jgi:DNA-binding CsgD family transcriptional regulator
MKREVGMSIRYPFWKKVVDLGKIEKRKAGFRLSDIYLQAWTHALLELPSAPVTEADILAWVEGPLRSFFPFERFLGGYGILSCGRIQRRSLVTSGHTPEFLEGLESAFDLNSRGCFAWWVSNRKAFILDKTGGLDDSGRRITATKREIEEVERFSLGVVAAHGVIDPYFNGGTYVSFAGVPNDKLKRTLAALDLVAPVLHNLFLAIAESAYTAVETAELTDRQRDLVDLAIQGLSDKEIAVRLGISHNTVGNHFSVIYAKLGIRKRTQLVALMK